jgi:hypothetical protein
LEFERLRIAISWHSEISTGFVIDSAGQLSRQQDIVIYRRGYHPIFVVGGIHHFMVESVAAVMQNRASIASRESLVDALDTISSAKALDRTNRGTNYVVHGSNRGETIDDENFFHQVWGGVATEASLALRNPWRDDAGEPGNA